MAEFFYMEGHGFYVWTSYGLGLVVFVALFLSTHLTTKRLSRQLARQFRMQEQPQNNMTDHNKSTIEKQ